MKLCTAEVCSTSRNSWRLRLPETVRQSPAFAGAELHRFLARPTAVRSLRASIARPVSVRARRRPEDGARTTSPKPSMAATICDARERDTPSSPAKSRRSSHGQSASRSSARFSAGFRRAGRR